MTTIKMARATDQDIEELTAFFFEIERLNEEGYSYSDDPAEILEKLINLPINGWRRIINGYSVLVQNACDLSDDCLAFNQEIKDLVTNSEHLSENETW